MISYWTPVNTVACLGMGLWRSGPVSSPVIVPAHYLRAVNKVESSRSYWTPGIAALAFTVAMEYQQQINTRRAAVML
eukprot:7117616-Prymnesium_polylepis.2